MNKQRQAGFSLMEVLMAIGVISIGILSMAVLYPLGLRESTQGRADLMQSMFADNVLNQVVALASQTNVTWSVWKSEASFSSAILGQVKLPVAADGSSMANKSRISVSRISDQVMGITVQSSDLKNVTAFANNPVFYTEVRFQGDPGK